MVRRFTAFRQNRGKADPAVKPDGIRREEIFLTGNMPEVNGIIIKLERE